MRDEKCTDPQIGKLIGNYENGSLKGDPRERFEIHLVHCTFCLNQTLQNQPIIRNMRLKAPTLITRIPRERPNPKPLLPERMFSLSDSRSWAGLALIFLAAIVAIFIYTERGRRLSTEHGVERASPEFRVLDLSPSGLIDSAPTEFQWRDIPNAGYYQVELFDEFGKSLWRQETARRRLSLPDSLRLLLRPGYRYTWEIRAVESQKLRPFHGSADFMIRLDSPSHPTSRP
ncbi:MAG: hypothetical protein HYR55_02150 [Acidobacteria bacterium]|nr:hypothetical protein [Acidobacteriota bacterium]MBI3655407.1 hypothetical protein [Acidobacteriota bacterium]